MRYKIAIHIKNKKYLDPMILHLVYQGYDVYYNDDEKVLCFTACEDEVTAIPEKQ